MDLSLVKIDPLTGEAVFGLQTQPVTGINLLNQMVISSLLTMPGSDTLDVTQGGGIESLVGAYNLNPEDLSEIQPEIIRILNVTQEEIVINQIGLGIPAEEKLRRLSLVSLTPDVETGELRVRIRVENEVGRTRDVVI